MPVSRDGSGLKNLSQTPNTSEQAVRAPNQQPQDQPQDYFQRNDSKKIHASYP